MTTIDDETRWILRGATRERLALSVINMAEEIANLRCKLAIAHWEAERIASQVNCAIPPKDPAISSN